MKYELLTTNEDGVRIYARIDDDGLITVQVLDEKGQPIDGKEYEVELKNVEKIEF